MSSASSTSSTAVALQKGLPANIDAERFILGSVLLDDARFIDIAGVLTNEDFALEKHRRIFTRMSELHERSEKIDRVTVANELLRYNELESVDGLSYLVSLDDGLPHISNLDSYVKIVRDKATLRRIAVASQHLMNRALMAEDDPEDILAGAEETLLQAGRIAHRQGTGDAAASDPGLRRRPQRVSRSEQADQRHQHRVHEAGRNDGRPARRRAR